MPKDVIAWQSDCCRLDKRASEDFDKSCRLLKAEDYSKVFSTRLVVQGPLFTIHYRQGNGSGARLGLTIPKKQARTAVLRNAIKRQAREVFRCRQSVLPIVDMVLRLTRPVSPQSADKTAWRYEIGHLFDRLGRRKSTGVAEK